MFRKNFNQFLISFLAGKKKFSIIILVSGFTLFFLSLIIIPKVIYKYYEFTKRFRTLEHQVSSYGKYIVSNIESYQKTRKMKLQLSGIDENIKFNWHELDIPWNKEEYETTKAITLWGDNLVVGLSSKVKGKADIYMYDEKKWSKLNDNKNLSSVDWKKLNYVQVLCAHNEKLYAGINNTVLVYDKEGIWKEVKNVDEKYPWKDQLAYSMIYHNDYLYVGIYGSTSIYRLENLEWKNISLGLDKFPGTGIYEMLSHTDGNLYASTVSKNKNSAIFKLNTNTINWEHIGGNGINGSWINSGFNYGFSMSSHKDFLFVTLNRAPLAVGNFSSIWAYDGKEWFVIGSENVPVKWGQMNTFNSSISYKDMFFIGAGGHPAGNVSVWILNNNQWTLIGGFGVNNSWGPNFPHTLAKSFRHTASEYPYRFIVWNNSLITGFGDNYGAATLWQLNVTKNN